MHIGSVWLFEQEVSGERLLRERGVEAEQDTNNLGHAELPRGRGRLVEVYERRGELRCEIRSEEDAWDLLRRIDEGEFQDRAIIPKFIGWPKLEIKFWVDSDQRVLTGPMMEGLLSFQASINRAFLLIEEDTTNLRSLSEEDRKREEVRFKIKSGSTGVDPDLISVIKEFVKSAGANMSGREVTVAIIAVALLWASVAAWRAWLDYKAKTAQDDTSSANIKEILNASRVATEADVEKMALMTRAVESALNSRALIETGDEGKWGIIRAASKVDNTTVAGVEVPPETARRLVRNPRTNPSRQQLTSTFRVVRTDPEYPQGFRVKIRDEKTDEEFFAGLRDALISEEDRNIIMNAEWEHTSFHATIAILRHRGEVTSAEIVAVSRDDGSEQS